MADSELENTLGVVDRRKTQGQLMNPGNMDVDARYLSVGDLRVRLAAINGAYYTSARLNEMTKNDMVYAVRNSDDAGGM